MLSEVAPACITTRHPRMKRACKHPLRGAILLYLLRVRVRQERRGKGGKSAGRRWMTLGWRRIRRMKWRRRLGRCLPFQTVQIVWEQAAVAREGADARVGAKSICFNHASRLCFFLLSKLQDRLGWCIGWCDLVLPALLLTPCSLSFCAVCLPPSALAVEPLQNRSKGPRQAAHYAHNQAGKECSSPVRLETRGRWTMQQESRDGGGGGGDGGLEGD